MNRISSIASLTVSAMLLCSGYASAEVLFEDNFESGNLDKWTMAVDLAEVVGNPVREGSRSLHIPYDLPGGDSIPRDNNRFVQVDMAQFGLDNFYVKGCFYLASTPAPTSQRKLYYIWGDPHKDPKWDIVVSAWGGTSDTDPLKLSIGSNNHPYSNIRIPIKNIALGRIQYDTWHCLDLRVQLNTPGMEDGFLELWVDGVLEAEKPNLTVRADDKPLGMVRVGAQINRSATDTKEHHEDRYWDDVSIGTGVMPGTSPPRPPSELNAN